MKIKTTWIQLADNAMKRAAQRARDVAWHTNTPLHVMREGQIVKLIPGPEKGAFREELSDHTVKLIEELPLALKP